MKVIKRVVFVALVVAVALGLFNGTVVVLSACFGPFYDGHGDQRRKFAIWLVGNGVVVVGALAGGVMSLRRGSRN